MRRIQIADLDGCISDDRHRRHHIDPVLANDKSPGRHAERNTMFHAYHELCLRDEVCNLDKIVHPYVVFLTGRPVRYHELTMLWLSEVALIKPLYIMMRNNNDHRPSAELKRQMVRGLLDHNSYGIKREELVYAIDDREDIVQMYRQDYGLEADVVRIGEDEHVHG